LREVRNEARFFPACYRAPRRDLVAWIRFAENRVRQVGDPARMQRGFALRQAVTAKSNSGAATVSAVKRRGGLHRVSTVVAD